MQGMIEKHCVSPLFWFTGRPVTVTLIFCNCYGAVGCCGLWGLRSSICNYKFGVTAEGELNMKTQRISTVCGLAAVFACVAGASAGVELANSDRGFELGDLSGWESFPTADSTFMASSDAFSGNFSGELTNSTEASAAVIKQTGLGAGQLMADQAITISFWAKGSGAVGGVSFAELFSADAGGGITRSELLGGAPLFVGSDWSFYSFTTVVGPDVSGGVTIQFAAVTGAANGSMMQLYLDDVSVTADVVPAPGAMALLGLGGLVGARRRR